MFPSELDDHWLYQCDGIVVDPSAHLLERDGQAQPVEPKVYTVLVTLLQQAGKVVDKDALLDAAWGHRCITPGVLSHAVSQLRRALGDSALHPRYIATVHTIGYRFIGEVHRRAPPYFRTDRTITRRARSLASRPPSQQLQLPPGNPVSHGAFAIKAGQSPFRKHPCSVADGGRHGRWCNGRSSPRSRAGIAACQARVAVARTLESRPGDHRPILP